MAEDREGSASGKRIEEIREVGVNDIREEKIMREFEAEEYLATQQCIFPSHSTPPLHTVQQHFRSSYMISRLFM